MRDPVVLLTVDGHDALGFVLVYPDPHRGALLGEAFSTHAIAATQNRHLANLALFIGDALHAHVVDGRCHFYIHISPLSERLNKVGLSRYPCKNAGFNRRVVGEHKAMALVGYQHRTQQVGR